MRILLTGGAGYIGSHTAAVLAQRGHEIVILDNFANAERDVPARLARLTGQEMTVIEADIRDTAAVSAALKAHPVEAVIHFAALKAVGESEADPLLYYDMNIIGTIRLMQAMQATGVARLVFSSSATVYGQPDSSPILEDAPTRVENIYGRTKLVMEDLIRDLARTGKLKGAANLRYFNPVGAHPSAVIGETPRGVPNNLMPYVTQVATGERARLNVFGNDYPTRDGTGERDYIHVMDLALAHALAVEHITAHDVSVTVNLGTGNGTTVLELVKAFKAATGREIPVNIAPRRAGDVASYYANPALAEKLFGWKAERGVEDMCRDSWRWQAARAGINDI
ncbi:MULTISPECIES: UDP-glucose 4-epimerase GalE [unclassified Acidocella]|uniref:UDP-glucose 4-epimerase GalE n=1 Tax=unclassified Acidocella TaxID=2648610 RepID=UPI00028CC720|nr:MULTISPECIES: UDP-glucose 4-epimerase GalE [unclassified Acidocella]EKN00018.1 UDP-glucose 4-epimerase [Acidocella sp. MX-AZ02]WBO59619.1 UDP-glucose 4-epimerase GalE [Acidocella sp. MX-AZ03]